MKTLTFNNIGLFVFLTAFILSSCKKNDTLLPSTADRIEGQWQFDQVKFRKNVSLSGTNLTDDYKDLVITFKDNFIITKTNIITGQQSQGDWEVTTDWNTYTNMGQAVEIIKGTLINPTGQTEKLKWENFSITKKKIKATEYKDGGSYRYTLVRH